MSAPQPRPLHVVRPPNPYRIEGGDPPALDGDTWPFAKLPNAIYAIVVTSWRLAPIVRSARPMREGATEREADWRLFVGGHITDVVGGEQEPAARSAIFRYRLANPGDPLLCVSYRVAVGERTSTRRIPRGGRLAQLWEVIGHRGETAAAPSALAAPSQQALLREAGLCGHRTRAGGFCRAPWNEESGSCGMGHGLTREQVSTLRREAARASHAVEAQVDTWARKIDWSSAEGVLDTLEMAAEMVMRRLLSPQQASAIAQLAGVRLRPVQKPAEDARALVVEVARFNGHAEPAA